MKKPSGKTYSCKYAREKFRGVYGVRVTDAKSHSYVFLDIYVKDVTRPGGVSMPAILLTPDDARSLARDLKRAAKILEKGLN